MTIKQAIDAVKNGNPIIVGDKTMAPDTVDEVKLKTNERVYWVRSDDAIWLSLDAPSEEILVFTDIEEEFDPAEDALFYANEDYELSFETEDAKLVDEDGEEEAVMWRDYESGTGRVVRITEYEVSGDIIVSTGTKAAEEELGEV